MAVPGVTNRIESVTAVLVLANGTVPGSTNGTGSVTAVLLLANGTVPGVTNRIGSTLHSAHESSRLTLSGSTIATEHQRWLPS